METLILRLGTVQLNPNGRFEQTRRSLMADRGAGNSQDRPCNSDTSYENFRYTATMKDVYAKTSREAN